MAILWPNGLTTPPAVSSPFGPRGSGAYGDASTLHLGCDFTGYETIHSIADGEVVLVDWFSAVGWKPVAGFMVWVMHDGFLSRSLHTDAATPRVSVGDRVRAGDPLVDMGYSGLTDGAGNLAPWREHHHLEIVITDRWHAGNYGQVDPYAWLLEHVTTTTTGAGGSAARPDETHPEEDEMSQPILVRVKDRAGRHYALDTEFLKQIKDVESVKVEEKVTGRKEIEISGAEFDIMIAIRGIPSNALDAKGRVLNILEGGGYVHGGTWSRGRAAERKGFEAVKAAKAK